MVARGAYVDRIYPDSRAYDLSRLRVEHDLYVLKPGTEAALALAGALHAAGAITLNSYPLALMLRKRSYVMRALHQSGVPTPESFLTASAQALAPFPEGGPLIVIWEITLQVAESEATTS